MRIPEATVELGSTMTILLHIHGLTRDNSRTMILDQIPVDIVAVVPLTVVQLTVVQLMVVQIVHHIQPRPNHRDGSTKMESSGKEVIIEIGITIRIKAVIRSRTGKAIKRDMARAASRPGTTSSFSTSTVKKQIVR
jgi:hypothetical protein